MTFSLPPEITFKKERLEGCWVYTFCHKTVGKLGRIVLQGLPNGQSHIACEVSGEPDDPMTQTRLNILRPVSLRLIEEMEAVIGSKGKGKLVTPPPSPKGPIEVVKSKLIPCLQCGTNVAMLIFTGRTQNNVSDFEDYARKMYPQYRDLNVPTWIIGEPIGKPGMGTPSRILKVWPNREEMQEITPDAFNAELDKLLDRHCQ